MVEVLNSEGYDVTARQISSLRIKDGLKLRSLNGNNLVLKRKRSGGEGGEGEGRTVEGEGDDTMVGGGAEKSELQLPIEIAIKRQARQAQLWAESVERLRNGTRRRRTKGRGGLPPDVGLPPRFPSELTLEESRDVLGLDKNLYFQIRDMFFEICQRKGVIKKTITGPEKWAEAKDEVIDRCPHLQGLFRSPHAGRFDPNREPMALDVICMDVTKKLRTIGKYLSLIEAKNILGLTPDESREVGGAFDEILKADFFTGKLDVTKEHWEDLKGKWIQQSPRLQREFNGIEEPAIWQRKYKALESLGRDVQKRNRDLQTKRVHLGANARKPATSKKSKPAKPPKTTPNRATAQSSLPQCAAIPNHKPWMLSQRTQQTAASLQDTSTSSIEALASQALSTSNSPPSITAEHQIDPTLLEAAARGMPPPSAPANQALSPSPIPSIAAASIYIRPSPVTAFKNPSLPKVWLEMLPEPYTISNLKNVIGKKVGAVDKVGKIEGLADGRTIEGEEGSSWGIDEDDELEAYVAYVGKEGKKTFVFEIG